MLMMIQLLLQQPTPCSSVALLTFAFASGRLVEREAKRDDGGSLQDDESDVLQGLPHEFQESLGFLRGDEVLAECLAPALQVCWVPTKTLVGKVVT